MGGSSLSFKALFRTLMLLGLIFVGLGTLLLQSRGNKTTRIVNHDESWSSLEEQADGQGKGKSTLVHQRMDLNYMSSKRRVPNGPDPIHNRRAGHSRRPPRHA
ncbi:hypothetical protein V6N13_017540 [Hibiscus sabdariffa]|uniref:CLAVATA3/ESR (CLE)-related protein 25 n=2 Tax=Hibiscus sabdariffa TaxID=183260 RepID=A0ABR2AH30_9ROSI